MAIPMILFYEVGILVARIVGKKRTADEPATAS
jgi:Sec-independent protein secretion pathway component TatC